MTEVNPFRRLRAVGAAPVGDDPEQALGLALGRSGRGDEAAFTEVYDLTAPMVHGIVVQVVRDPAMAEEVTQEVFLELWRLAPRYEAGRGSARGWIATMAHRRAVDRVRSEQARRDRDEREGEKVVRAFDQVADEVTDRLDRSRLEQALAGLSEAQAEAVRLAYYGGKTYREVAILLAVPEGTAKTRIRDGLIKLRDEFEVTL